ncbi:methylated-DNA--[protein]-cysteine S-methyltransferase [Oceanibaculum sp.]|uniref:methylated-DNA--[protein]-cysteine S-methyltransferase n=1 Tax=Oceanibaculum sp. TaxID=1903597 RepID=UPI0025852DE6|nr:methylated-DNA--[protein]-cysteine S-methyltransferase [Oceanibaculum sp.]MCH2393517.1 methylated-DNA--[protein]-cysteine S-methyltransferase [Oceanibaculum sp.]
MTAPLARLTLNSPVGPLTLTVQDGAICAVRFAQGGPDKSENPVLQEAAKQISSYFARELKQFDLPLNLRGSDHNLAVWQEMLTIPYGETLTYGDIAQRIGSNPRAVGTACGANPIPLIVPCHRVIGKDGTLVGFSGGDGKKTKARLLDHEAPALPLLAGL